jgi:hypothetical protein
MQGRYKVRVLKNVIKQGYRLNISDNERLDIIGYLRDLQYWPDNSCEYEHEKAFGVHEFKFTTKDQWIRAFVHQEDFYEKAMVVLYVTEKKKNKLGAVERIAVETAMSVLQDEYKEKDLKKS